jgi:hypothetical protein
MSGAKVVEALKEAVSGDLARVTVEGQIWVRKDEIENYERSYNSMWAGNQPHAKAASDGRASCE